MKNWSLIYEDFNPSREGLREALCTLGNGYFATRGAAPESPAGDLHYPGTYLAGGYNRLGTEMAGRVIENEDLVNLPNWLVLTFRIDGGEWFDLEKVEIISFRQELDLRRGILLRDVHFRDGEGRETRLSSRRFVHMSQPHLAALETRLTPVNWSGSLEIHSGLDGRVVNAGVKRYQKFRSKHLEVLATESVDQETVFLLARTNQSHVHIAQAARTRVLQGDVPAALETRTIEEPEYIAKESTVQATKGETVTVEKIVSLFTSRDHAISDCSLAARKEISRACPLGNLLEKHTQAWDHLWRRFDIEIEHQDPAQGDEMAMILRLHVFHLLQTASPHTIDLDTGVPARGWHGEAYRGHIFWDELFIFPILNYRMPEITRSLLMYRYRRLDEARAAAREAGYSGAMYPWQSGSDGREESQLVHLNPKSGRWIPDHSRIQRHVNAAIAYNIWQYYQVTRDLEFIASFGAEMFLEIARFWASLATYNEELGRYEILNVMGPDEYHDAFPDSDEPGLHNNTYTNIMTVWILCTALDMLALLPEDRRQELCESLDLLQKELDHWDAISRKMHVAIHDDGVISQFEGYEDLEEFDWEGYRKKYGNIQRLDRILEAEGDSPNRYKLSKQADMLMLFYLLSAEELGRLFNRIGYPFEPDTIPKNVEYHLKRTSHGSTLSRIVHSWVLARSDRKSSWELFVQALRSDIDDIQMGTTPEGIHLGAMAGTVDLLQRCATGLEIRGDALWFNPCLPEELRRLLMRVRYRGHTIAIDITHERLRVSALRCAQMPITIGFREGVYHLREGDTKVFELEHLAPRGLPVKM